MRAVLLDKQTFNDNISFNAIEQYLEELTCYQTTSGADLIERCIDADIIITNKVVLNKATLAQLPNLKLICIAATGTNNVDLLAAKALGITVTNVSGYARQSVVQYVFSQLLSLLSNTQHHNSNVQKGLWQQSSTFCLLGNGYEEVAGKTLSIIGYGSLGKAVECVANALEMKVLIAEREGATQIRAGRVSFEQALKEGDIISLHCPHSPTTEKLINAETLALMKNSTILINTARGAVVDEVALLDALNNKKIGHAILDVMSQEPPTADNELLNALVNKNLQNLTITAHIAWASNEAQTRLISGIADNISAFKAGEILNQV